MTTTAPAKDAPLDPEAVLRELRKKSNLITAQRRRRDNGGFKSVNDAIALQRLEREATKLRAQLPTFRLI